MEASPRFYEPESNECVKKLCYVAATGRWRGIVQGPADTTGTWRGLASGWVTTAFAPEFLAECRRTGAITFVPPGRAAPRSPPTAAPLAPHPPPVRYQQHDEDACTWYAAASALAYLGDSRAAEHVAAARSTVRPAADPLRALSNVVTRSVGGWTPRSIPSFDPLADDLDGTAPVVMQICDSDADTSHVVAIAGGRLFDPNAAIAPPVTAATLDAACFSGKFDRAARAIQLVPTSRRRAKLAARAAG